MNSETVIVPCTDKRGGPDAASSSSSSSNYRPKDPTDEALLLQFLPVIRKIAGSLLRRLPLHIRPDDLEAAGIVGLLQAAQLRDPDRAEQFDQYARRRIEGAMLDELRKGDTLPKDARASSNRIMAAMTSVEKREGAIEEASVAAELGVAVDEYRALLEKTVDVRLLSLEGTETGRKLQTNLSDQEPTALDVMLQAEDCAQVAAALGRLPDKQRKILALYYVEELNMKEIALALGLTTARVCQLHSEAVHSVRTMLVGDGREA